MVDSVARLLYLSTKLEHGAKQNTKKGALPMLRVLWTTNNAVDHFVIVENHNKIVTDVIVTVDNAINFFASDIDLQNWQGSDKFCGRDAECAEDLYGQIVAEREADWQEIVIPFGADAEYEKRLDFFGVPEKLADKIIAIVAESGEYEICDGTYAHTKEEMEAIQSECDEEDNIAQYEFDCDFYVYTDTGEIRGFDTATELLDIPGAKDRITDVFRF